MKTVSRFSLLLAGMITVAHAARKNVLLIAVDDLKPLIAAYGDPVAKTPNIDRLASRGLLFEHAYTNQALCAPSRNALLTGIRPSTLGIYNLEVNFRNAAPDAITLPQQFIRHGYRAEAIGKLYHTGHGNHDDVKSWSVPLTRPDAPPFALDENRPVRTGKEKPGQRVRGAAYESADVADDFYADGQIAKETVARLEAAKGREDTPFFIAAGFQKPHLPFVAPKKYWDLYDPAQLELAEFQEAPAGVPGPAFRRNGELRSYKGREDADSLSPDEQRRLLHGYYAAVSYADAQIGKVLDSLDRLGLTESTIVVLWGDHGWHLGDHGLWAKMTNFEEAARIPFIISAPGVTKPGGKTEALAQTVDVYPTLLELAGVPSPETTPELEGKSLVPVLKDPAAKVHDSVLHVVPNQGYIGRAIRTATHRFVEWKKPGEEALYELYDYGKDPREKKNHVDDQPETVEELKKELAEYPEAKPQMAGKAAADAPKQGGQDRARLFRNRDKNGDGKLTAEEFLANQKDQATAPARLKKFDKDGDGILTREEFIKAGN